MPGAPLPVPATHPDRRGTDRLLTLAGWLLVVGGALLLPVAAISLLMLIARSHGTANATLGGVLLIVGGPPTALITGIGMIRRWRWAHPAATLAAVAVVGIQLAGVLKDPVAPHTQILPSGTRVTVTGSGRSGSVVVLVVAAAMTAWLLTPAVRRRFRPADHPGATWTSAETEESGSGTPWRAGHRGRDAFFYEERHLGVWRRVEIPGEMLMGTPHHLIYPPSPSQWTAFPAWIRDRRDEVIGRLRSRFPEPDYRFQGEAVGPIRVAPILRSVAEAARPSAVAPSPAARPAAIPILLVTLLAVAGFFFWLAAKGVSTGKVPLPKFRGSPGHTVERTTSPGVFWAAVGFHSLMATTCLGLSGMVVRAAVRPVSRR